MFNRSRMLLAAMASAFGSAITGAAEQAAQHDPALAALGPDAFNGKRRPRAYKRCNAAALKREARTRKNIRARSRK